MNMKVEEPLKEIARCIIFEEGERKFKFIKARWSEQFGFLITIDCQQPCTEKGI